MNEAALKRALELAQQAKQGDNYAPPSETAQLVWEAIPEVAKPFLRPPRGVQNEEGDYVGSIIQVVKGGLGRLHGLPLEMVTSAIFSSVRSLDERSEDEQSENPFLLQIGGELIPWDVRRYSSTQVNGKWQSIPDYSLYIDTTFSDMRKALSSEEPEEIDEDSGPKKSKPNRGRGSAQR